MRSSKVERPTPDVQHQLKLLLDEVARWSEACFYLNNEHDSLAAV